MSARGFWTRGQDAFFDVSVFNPDASSYASRSLDALFRQHEGAKRLQYQERVVNVERGVFAPLVFSVNGAAAPASTAFLRRLCLLTSQSSGGSYSSLMGYYRCRVSFALLRSAVLCVGVLGRPVIVQFTCFVSWRWWRVGFPCSDWCCTELVWCESVTIVIIRRKEKDIWKRVKSNSPPL